MHLKSLLVEPPGSWYYTQPETGHQMKEVTFGMLVQRIAQHRANMKIETKGDLAAEIEKAICNSLSHENQIAHCEFGITAPRSVHWTAIQQFLTTAAAFVLGPDTLVTQEEAERRAGICSQCPLNVGLHGCAICRSTLNSLREKLTTRKTAQDDRLLACGVCGCDNRIQVHVPLSALATGSGDLVYPAWCWRNPIPPEPAASPTPG